MDEKKYTVDLTGPSIEEFLDMVFDHLDLDVEYEILEGQHLHPDLEDPDLLVKFTGPEVDALLANKAELMLAVGISHHGSAPHAGRAPLTAVLRRQRLPDAAD